MQVILKDEIIQKLKEVGLKNGDTVMVHTSLGKMGYVCGGAQIYAAAIAYADELWITRIEQSYTGDTWFPAFCIGDFRLLSNEQKEGCSIMHYRRR